MDKDYKTCVFATQTACKALDAMYCKKKQACRFYKSKDDWYLNTYDFPTPKKKGGSNS